MKFCDTTLRERVQYFCNFPPAARVAGISGSHGGELLKHLDGQYFFKKRKGK